MNQRAITTTIGLAAAGFFVSADASTNLLLNPGFELPGLVAPTNQAPGADDWVTFNTAGIRTAEQRSGSQSLRLAPNGSSGTASGIARQTFSAAANDVLTFGAWVRNPSSDPLTGSRTAQLRVQWLNDSGTLINQTILNVADADTPQDFWINFTLVDLVLPDNANIASVRPSLFVTNDGGTGGGAAFFDDVVFTNQTAELASQVAAIPEPASLALLGLGGAALLSRRRSRID